MVPSRPYLMMKAHYSETPSDLSEEPPIMKKLISALTLGLAIALSSIISMLKYVFDGSAIMPAVERMTITMPAEMAETLRQTVAGGEYASTSEVVREALRDWTRRRDGERQDLETLRAAIKAGLDSGPGIPADQVFAELRARYAAKT